MRSKSAVEQLAVGRPALRSFSEGGLVKDESWEEKKDSSSIAPGLKRGKASSCLVKLTLLLSFLITAPSLLLAQADTAQTHTVDMATTMRSNGKIYVVVAVLTIILLGLFFYLIRLDRKIGKLEKE